MRMLNFKILLSQTFKITIRVMLVKMYLSNLHYRMTLVYLLLCTSLALAFKLNHMMNHNLEHM